MDNMFNDCIKNSFFNKKQPCGCTECGCNEGMCNEGMCNEGMCHSSNCVEDVFSCFGQGKRVHYAPCELCRRTGLGPVELDRTECRLLRVNLKLTNVCFGKDVSVAVIVKDRCGKILAYKSFTTKLTKQCGCSPFGTLERRVDFVLPEGDIGCPQDVFVSVKANYTNPCDSSCPPCC